VIGDRSAGTEIRGIAIYGGNSGLDNAIDFDNPGENVVERNFIGTDASGTVAKGRGGLAFRRASSGDGLVSSNNRIANNVIAGTTVAAVQLDEASDNQVLRNLIGTDASGSAGISGGLGVGIDLDAGSSRNLLADNVIASRNRGIRIFGSTGLPSEDNRIEGNRIGTDVTGEVDLGNSTVGIDVGGLSPRTVIGGADPARRNVISGNDGSGVFMTGAVGGTIVEGNFIGTNADGIQELANGGAGVALSQTGGPIRISGNVISGNKGLGISAFVAATGSVNIEGNLIGTDKDGAADIGNAQDGITISGNLADSVIGGESETQRNIISGNGGDGVSVGSPGLQILNNYIGTDLAGENALGNGQDGVHAAAGTIVGKPGAGNLISGNGGDGVRPSTSTVGDFVVQANLIGTDKSGTHDVGNGGSGVFFGASSEIRIGGSVSGERNVISGNERWGVEILPGNQGDNVVEDNRIGTDIDGVAPIPNNLGGLTIGAPFLGTTNRIVDNLISGNNGDGIRLQGGPHHLLGNLIGTDREGKSELGNAGDGVDITSSSLGENVIGGLGTGDGNVISGNRDHGLLVASPGNQILANRIGTDIDGSEKIANGLSGIRLTGGLNDVAGNVISGNGVDGVEIAGAGQHLTANLIGTGADGTHALGNARHGVSLTSNGSGGNNVIGGPALADRNTIAFNGQHGVLIERFRSNRVQRNAIFSNGGDGVAIIGVPTQGATGNTVSENSIYSNDGLGIDLQDDGVTGNDLGDGDGGTGLANFLQNFPANLDVSADRKTVTGTLNSRPNTTYRIELFGNDACDLSDHGEGETLLEPEGIDPETNVVMTDGSGNAPFSVRLKDPLPGSDVVTATATDVSLVSSGNTSEFSPCAEPPATIVVRKLTEPSPDPTDTSFAFTAGGGLNPATFSLKNGESRTFADLTPQAGYSLAETTPAGWDLTSNCDDGSPVTNIDLAPGETVTCTFTNTKRGLARVVKTVNGAPPSGAQSFPFELRQGASPIVAGSVLESKSATATNGGAVDFTTTLVPDTTYALCETVMPGWMTTLGPPFYVVYNPSGDNSTVCTDFTVEPGQTRTFAIDNKPPPGGLARTIGFWKNWASCAASKGKQRPVLDGTLAAADPAGITIGALTLHGGDCLKAVRLLDKSTVNTGKKMASDPAFALAAQLLAAKLNVVAGAGTCPAAVSAINDGQALLAAVHFDGIAHDRLTAAQSTAANALAATLDLYDNNLLC
jgi:hypothetical protein